MSLAAMGNVTVVLCLNFIIFGIMGVNLFGGRFYSCNDTTVPNKVTVSALTLCALQPSHSAAGAPAVGIGCVACSYLSAVSVGYGWCLSHFR